METTQYSHQLPLQVVEVVVVVQLVLAQQEEMENQAVREAVGDMTLARVLEVQETRHQLHQVKVITAVTEMPTKVQVVEAALLQQEVAQQAPEMVAMVVMEPHQLYLVLA
jgi:hypothetical protein